MQNSLYLCIRQDQDCDPAALRELAGHGGPQGHRRAARPDRADPAVVRIRVREHAGPLQRWGWQDWHLHWPVQTHPGLSQWQGKLPHPLVTSHYCLQITVLDPFATVLAMRRQRIKMVQKPMQYHYMIRCMADYVAGVTSDYVWWRFLSSFFYFDIHVLILDI